MLPRAWAAALNGLIWLKCSRRLAQRLIVLTAAHHRLVPLWMSTGFMACSMSYCCSLAHCMRGCCLIVTGLDSLLPLLEVECKRFCMTSLTVFVFLFPDSERERECVCLSTYLYLPMYLSRLSRVDGFRRAWCPQNFCGNHTGSPRHPLPVRPLTRRARDFVNMSCMR